MAIGASPSWAVGEAGDLGDRAAFVACAGELGSLGRVTITADGDQVSPRMSANRLT
jgi:hypothetical protein